MRILLTTRGSAGHLTPLAPFGHAALRAGHEVLVAAQRQHAGNVERVARVALGLEAVEALSIDLAAAAVDEARARLGLPPDPAGDRLRDTPFLTMIPDALEDPAVPAPQRTHRFRHAVSEDAPPLPGWWPGNDDPLVYVTFGSVTAGAHLPYFPALYKAAIDALAPHAAAIVGHGGHGTTLGALVHGVPQVVVPLFSIDQWANAAAVERAGAGVALNADRGSRRVLARPGPGVIDGLGPAVQRVLAEPSHHREAQRIAAAMRALPPAEAALDVLAAMLAGPPARACG
jgi:UDP:flavonoid glycosyltransferase YjiC (YdhE family)